MNRRVSTAVLASLAGLASATQAQEQVVETRAMFASAGQSMWASGSSFVYDWGRDFTVGADTGSLEINPPPVSGSGVTVDTRFAVSAAATLGVGVGFGLDSGTVNAFLDYDVALRAPTSAVAGQFFSIEAQATMRPGSELRSVSPTAYAHLDGILAVSNNLFAEARVDCSSATALFGGISRGTFQHRSYPLVSVNLRETLFGFNPGGDGRLYWKGQDVGGVGQVITIGSPLAPAAEITVGDWRINTVDTGADGRLIAQGSTTLFTALLDVDASLTGGSPVTGAGIDVSMSRNIRLSTGYDVIDFDSVYELGYSQRFEVLPDVLVQLDFSRPVTVRWPDGSTGQATRVGPVPLDALPQIGVPVGQVVVTPTYLMDAELRNDTDLVMDLDFAAAVARGWFNFRFDSGVYDTSVRRDFGPLWSRGWAIPTPTVGVYDQTFELGGFNTVRGAPFTIEGTRTGLMRAR